MGGGRVGGGRDGGAGDVKKGLCRPERELEPLALVFGAAEGEVALEPGK